MVTQSVVTNVVLYANTLVQKGLALCIILTQCLYIQTSHLPHNARSHIYGLVREDSSLYEWVLLL